jgi:phenylpropionate dioxygenase-like ring-hydroxylating dioxygenase large terminal subunit
LFNDFANVWTPVELSSRLRGKPVGVTVAGERVVLFRDQQGRAAALIDRCPHRGVKLSLGHTTPDGAIVCPFHGWEFRADGSCAHVPNLPSARCEHLGAIALPVVERANMVWLYTAPGPMPAEGPVLDESLADDGRYSRAGITTTWRTHWTRVMENMLDMPHLPFVHRESIGLPFRQRMRRDSETKITYEATPHGARTRAFMDGVEDKGWLEFARPNRMTLTLSLPGLTSKLHVFCVPVSRTETRLVMLNARDFLRWLPLGRLICYFNGRVGKEDQAVVESSDPAEVPPAAQERSVAYDGPTLRFRQYYHDQLKGSAAVVAPREAATSEASLP